MAFNLDALEQNDEPGDEDAYRGLPQNHVGRLDGQPGLVWYASVKYVLGSELKVDDWLDSLDHRGARRICYILDGNIAASDFADIMAGHKLPPEPDNDVRTVMFSAGDTETVRRDVQYDVVDPDSQVTPDGTPVVSW